MSVILVAEQDAGFAASIAEHLTAEGWKVHRVDGRDAAFRAVTTMKPGLLLASASMPDAKDLLAAFSRRRGGPGAVVMVPAPHASQVSAADFEADVLLAKPFSDVDLKNTVRTCLAQAAQDASRPATDGIQAGGQQLTSADIFGDVLAEVEAEATRARRAASKARKRTSKDEIERKLEETLSGVLLSDLKPRRSSDSAAGPAGSTADRPAPRPKRKEELPTEREIDDLLDKTLSSLELPTRARRAAQKPAPTQQPAPRPAAPQPATPQTAAPQPSLSAPQPAAPTPPAAPQPTAPPPIAPTPPSAPHPQETPLAANSPISDAAVSPPASAQPSGSPEASNAAALPSLSPPPAFEPPPSFQAPPALESKAPAAPSGDGGASAFGSPKPSVRGDSLAPPLDSAEDDLLPPIDTALPDTVSPKDTASATSPLGDLPAGTFEPLLSEDAAAEEPDPWTPPPALSTPSADMPSSGLPAAGNSAVGKASGAFAVDGDDPWRDLRGLSTPASFDDTGAESGAFTLKEDEASDPWKATAPEDLFPDSFGSSGADSGSSLGSPLDPPPAEPSMNPPALAAPFEPPPPAPTPPIGSSSFEPAPSADAVSEAQLTEPMSSPPAMGGDAFATAPTKIPTSPALGAETPAPASDTDASNPLERFRSFLDQVDDSPTVTPEEPAPSQESVTTSPEPMLGTGSFTPPPFGAGSLEAGGLDTGSAASGGADTGSFVTGTGAFTPPPFETDGTDTGSFVTGTGAFTPPPFDSGGTDTGSFVTGTGAFTPPSFESGGTDTGSFVTGTGAFTPPPFEAESSTSDASETGSFVTGTGAFVPPAADTGSFVPPPAAPDAGAADALQGVLELRGSDENTSVNEVSGGQPFGDYTLLERIAVGGMAEVWRARRSGVEGFQKTVAIKKILSHLTDSTDFIDMFIDEAKLAAQLTHNHIIQIYDLGKVEDDYFIAMEFVDGKDLRTILKKSAAQDRPLPLNLALMIVAALARALDYAHRKKGFDDRALGLVHRDVSPQNVLISYEGEIKLCDFGIVKAVAKASTTQMGALKGKLQYMSPEQAWGKSVDSRSDIFSLGSVLFEVLSGEKLFTGDSEIGVLDAVRECKIRSLLDMRPDVPPAVDRIVAKALEQDPANRYATAGDMDNDIQDVLRDLQPGADSKDLSAFMASLFQPTLEAPSFEPMGDDSAAHMPDLSGAPSAVGETPPSAPLEAPPEMPAEGAPPPVDPSAADAKGGRGKLILGAAALLVLIAAAVFFFMQSDSSDPTTAPSTPAAAPATPPASTDAATPDGDTENGDADAPDEAAADANGSEEPSEDAGAAATNAESAATADDGDADPLDIEALVKEGLDAQQSELEERLQSEYEAKRRELEEKLAEAQNDAESSEPPPDNN